LRKAFSTELYIIVLRDTFKIVKVSEPGSEQVFTPSQAFTTQRLLVGQFSIAEHCLKNAINSVVGKSFISKSIAVVVHPREMVDGGLSEVEEKVLRELCLSAGAKKVAVWTGGTLGPQEVSKLLENA